MSFLFTSFDFSIPFPRISFCFITVHSKPEKKSSVFCSWSEKRTIKQFEFLTNSWKKYFGRIVLPPSHLPKCQDLHRCSPFFISILQSHPCFVTFWEFLFSQSLAHTKSVSIIASTLSLTLTIDFCTLTSQRAPLGLLVVILQRFVQPADQWGRRTGKTRPADRWNWTNATSSDPANVTGKVRLKSSSNS